MITSVVSPLHDTLTTGHTIGKLNFVVKFCDLKNRKCNVAFLGCLPWESLVGRKTDEFCDCLPGLTDICQNLQKSTTI